MLELKFTIDKNTNSKIFKNLKNYEIKITIKVDNDIITITFNDNFQNKFSNNKDNFLENINKCLNLENLYFVNLLVEKELIFYINYLNENSQYVIKNILIEKKYQINDDYIFKINDGKIFKIKFPKRLCDYDIWNVDFAFDYLN